ncbi:putative membrane protein YGL010W [Herbaspirillum rubrisubalbicans]|uniref:Mpo1 family 2-hydroxy fatty acid dioxygenase n=1 Tax=Herbaspirillum rubrisubalbicans TaxID=80842 RepID=UPI00209E03FF|nr:Mpo1-like protein [Herbaspirillum rubrisubalbicans]MCP1571816.1 putative membrane protein YGL010W [Herbaspirillum rubrisubalbicans]
MDSTNSTDITASQRPIDALLARYAEHHRHPMNELIHCVCVPAIVFSLLGLCWMISPAVSLLVAAAALAYYLRLSPPFAVGMLAMSALMLVLLARLPLGAVLPVSAVVFVLAWIGQFIGHRIEGKKPSFFEDLRFLLVGPLFVLAFLYRRWNISY